MAALLSALLSACLSLAPSAHASPLFELAGDAGGAGGFAARHTGPGGFSTYFNPSLLPLATPQLSVRAMILLERIDIHVAPRNDASTLVPVTAVGAFHDDGNFTPVTPPPVPTSWLQSGCTSDCDTGLVDSPASPRPRQAQGGGRQTVVYAGLGLVQPIVDRRLVLGFSMLVPTTTFIGAHAFYNDEREQYFTNSLHPELYGDRLTPLSVAFGAGSEILEGLSVGLSFSLNLNNGARTPTFVPEATAYEELELSNRISVQPSVAPHLGVTYRPIDAVGLTATLHTEQALEVEAAFSSLLPDGSEQLAVRRFTHHFVPLTVSLGASYSLQLDDHTLSTVAGINFARWSTYRDRHNVVPTGRSRFSDRFQPTVGLAHAMGPWTSGVQMTWLPSPVPTQAGRSNYVDSDRWGFAATLRRRVVLGGVAIQVGVAVQAHHLVHRSHSKRRTEVGPPLADAVVDEVPDNAVEKLDPDQPVEPRIGLQTNNPGFPGFASSGWILGGSLDLTVEL